MTWLARPVALRLAVSLDYFQVFKLVGVLMEKLFFFVSPCRLNVTNVNTTSVFELLINFLTEERRRLNARHRMCEENLNCLSANPLHHRNLLV